MTKAEWATGAALLATFYPNQFSVSIDPEDARRPKEVQRQETRLAVAKMQAWYEGLADLPGDRVLAAIKHMTRTQAAFPSLADIRKHAEPGPIAWGEAWAEVMKAVGMVGMYGVPTWSDPAVGRAVEALGGWLAICEAPKKDHPTMRAQFRMAIEEANTEGRRDQTFHQLGVEPPKRLGAQKLGELLAPNMIKGLLGPGEEGKQ